MPDSPGSQDSAQQTTEWRRLREFKGVDLTNSFVLSWQLEGDDLQLDVDLCLLPEHALYEAPRPAQRACYRAASLVFPACLSLARRDGGVAAAAVATVATVAAALGHGRISGLERTGEGRYEIRGQFGRIAIRADRPLLKIRGSTS